MKRFIFSALSVLVLAAAITPTALASASGTSTCPSQGMHCVGSGGSAS